jgi:hypothetical protein
MSQYQDLFKAVVGFSNRTSYPSLAIRTVPEAFHAMPYYPRLSDIARRSRLKALFVPAPPIACENVSYALLLLNLKM